MSHAVSTIPALSSERALTFWEIVGRAFFGRHIHKVAVGWLLLLVLVAVFVPFIANGRPFTVLVKDGDAWVRQWPLFRTLTTIDYCIFVAAAGLLIYAFFHKRASRFDDPDHRSGSRVSAASLIAALVFTFVAVQILYMMRLLPAELLELIRPGSFGPDYIVRPILHGLNYLTTLPRVTWCVVAALLTLALFGITCLRSRNLLGAVEKREIRIRSAVRLTLLTLTACFAIAFARPDVLDSRDYRTWQTLTEIGSAKDAVFAVVPWSYADQEPLEKDLVYKRPTSDHPLGTDGNGRDALCRLLWSTRVVLGIGIISQLISVSIGIFYGAIMGYYSGRVDILGMRVVEMVEAIPTFFLIITAVAILGRNIFMIMVIIGLTSWTGIARFVRAEFLKLRKLDYVHAAIATGLPLRSVLFKHMLPNGLTPLLVTVTFGIAGAVGSEAGLSFLGLGVQPPIPSWGSMLNEAGNPAETFRWWLAIAPGLMIFLTVFAYNIIGEGLRDAIDPRTNRVR